MKLNPHYPSYYLMILGRTQFLQGDYVSAIATLERAVNITPGLTPSRTMLAASYWAAGREADARAQVSDLVQKLPT